MNGKQSKKSRALKRAMQKNAKSVLKDQRTADAYNAILKYKQVLINLSFFRRVWFAYKLVVGRPI